VLAKRYDRTLRETYSFSRLDFVIAFFHCATMAWAFKGDSNSHSPFASHDQLAGTDDGERRSGIGENQGEKKEHVKRDDRKKFGVLGLRRCRPCLFCARGLGHITLTLEMTGLML
jgi:hypothetical protein